MVEKRYKKAKPRLRQRVQRYTLGWKLHATAPKKDKIQS